MVPELPHEIYARIFSCLYESFPISAINQRNKTLCTMCQVSQSFYTEAVRLLNHDVHLELKNNAMTQIWFQNMKDNPERLGIHVEKLCFYLRPETLPNTVAEGLRSLVHLKELTICGSGSSMSNDDLWVLDNQPFKLKTFKNKLFDIEYILPFVLAHPEIVIWHNQLLDGKQGTVTVNRSGIFVISSSGIDAPSASTSADGPPPLPPKDWPRTLSQPTPGGGTISPLDENSPPVSRSPTPSRKYNLRKELLPAISDLSIPITLLPYFTERPALTHLTLTFYFSSYSAASTHVPQYAMEEFEYELLRNLAEGSLGSTLRVLVIERNSRDHLVDYDTAGLVDVIGQYVGDTLRSLRIQSWDRKLERRSTVLVDSTRDQILQSLHKFRALKKLWLDPPISRNADTLYELCNPRVLGKDEDEYDLIRDEFARMAGDVVNTLTELRLEKSISYTYKRPKTRRH